MSNPEKKEMLESLEEELNQALEEYDKYSKDITIDEKLKRKKLIFLQLTIGRATNMIKKIKGE